MDPSIYRMGHSDSIISKSLKRLSNFCFQDIAYIFIQFYKLLLNGYCLVYHCREKDVVCSPYSVDSVFFKLLTLAPMMPKQVLGIEDFDYWRAYLRPAVDQGIFDRLRTRT